MIGEHVSKTNLLTNRQIDEIRESNATQQRLAEIYNVGRATIWRVKTGQITRGIDDDDSISPEFIKVSKQKQRLQDDLRVSRKVNREAFRVVNVLEELNKQLIDTLEEHTFTEDSITYHSVEKGKPIGVIQLSDLHFGEQIHEQAGNRFDLDVASKRLQKLAQRAKVLFKSQGIGSVVVAMTGDIINSDRRLDELTTNAGPRSKIIFNAVDILQQFLRDINSDFNVTVASITGNESRLTKEVGWVDFMASENFDFTVHNILAYIFKESKGIKFVDIDDPLECVLDVNGMKLLLVHGHNGLAVTNRIENEVSKIRAKYISRGIKIDYVICGHIHSAFISDNYARSSGLPGNNGYSDKGLNLTGKSSQNIYVFHPDGVSIDGMKICLQDYSGYTGYSFRDELDVYIKDNQPRTVTIQSVLV